MKRNKVPKSKRTQIDHKFTDFYFAFHSKPTSTKSSTKSISKHKNE